MFWTWLVKSKPEIGKRLTRRPLTEAPFYLMSLNPHSSWLRSRWERMRTRSLNSKVLMIKMWLRSSRSTKQASSLRHWNLEKCQVRKPKWLISKNIDLYLMSTRQNVWIWSLILICSRISKSNTQRRQWRSNLLGIMLIRLEIKWTSLTPSMAWWKRIIWLEKLSI